MHSDKMSYSSVSWISIYYTWLITSYHIVIIFSHWLDIPNCLQLVGTPTLAEYCITIPILLIRYQFTYFIKNKYNKELRFRKSFIFEFLILHFINTMAIIKLQVFVAQFKKFSCDEYKQIRCTYYSNHDNSIYFKKMKNKIFDYHYQLLYDTVGWLINKAKKN